MLIGSVRHPSRNVVSVETLNFEAQFKPTDLTKIAYPHPKKTTNALMLDSSVMGIRSGTIPSDPEESFWKTNGTKNTW